MHDAPDSDLFVSHSILRGGRFGTPHHSAGWRGIDHAWPDDLECEVRTQKAARHGLPGSVRDQRFDGMAAMNDGDVIADPVAIHASSFVRFGPSIGCP